MVRDIDTIPLFSDPEELGAMSLVILSLPTFYPDFWARLLDPQCKAHVDIPLLRVQPESDIRI